VVGTLEESPEHLTYGALNRRADQLALALQQRGVGPEVVVGVYLERSLDMVTGVLGVLKAGGAYLPLDPNYPAERLAFMLEDSQAPVLLTQSHLVERLSMAGGWRLAADDPSAIICLDIEWDKITTNQP